MLDAVHSYRKKVDGELFKTIWRYPSQDYQTAAKNHAVAPFYLDIDSKRLGEAKKAALEIIHIFTEDLQIPADWIKLFFSGGKGFHLELDELIWGIKAGDLPQLPETYRSMAMELNRQCGSVDLGVYDSKRLWRVTNTEHKHGLYKVPLTINELEVYSADEIRKLARRPRKDIHELTRSRLTKIQEAHSFYRRHLTTEKVDIPEAGEVNPELQAELILTRKTPCIERLLEGVPQGERNNAAHRLASFFRIQGFNAAKTLEFLEEWNHDENKIPLPESEIHHVVSSAYKHKIYNYGCKDHLLERYCERNRCPIVKIDPV